MEKNFKRGSNTLFTERYGNTIRKFRRGDKRNIDFVNRLKSEEEIIKAIVSEDNWRMFSNYMDLVSLHNDIVCKYAYGQGLKDGITLANFFDTDFVEEDFNEIDFEEDEI